MTNRQLEVTGLEEIVLRVVIPLWGIFTLAEACGFFNTNLWIDISKVLFAVLILGQLRRLSLEVERSDVDGDHGRY